MLVVLFQLRHCVRCAGCSVQGFYVFIGSIGRYSCRQSRSKWLSPNIFCDAFILLSCVRASIPNVPRSPFVV